MTVIYSECGTDNFTEVYRLTARSEIPCHNHIYEGTICNVCRELAAVESQIEDLHFQLKKLHEKHRALRTKRNDLNNIINKLPYDIMSEIFLRCLPPLRTRFSPDEQPCHDFFSPSLPVILGSVCRSWRQLVQSIPRLWSTIAINMNRSNVEDITQRFQYSGSSMLLIRLYASSAVIPAYGLNTLALVQRNLHRIVLLCLNIPCHLAQDFFSQDSNSLGATPVMEELHFHCSFEDGGPCPGLYNLTTNSINPPLRPHRVFISRSSVKNIQLEWNSVRHLYYDSAFRGPSEGPAIQDVLSHFSEVNQLRVLDWAAFYGFRSASLPTGMSTITQNSMRYLRLYSETANIIFEFVTMPHLQALSLLGAHPEEARGLRSFLQRSTCQLKTLDLMFEEMPSEQELVDIFRYTPKLQQLCLNVVEAPAPARAIVCFLKHLGATGPESKSPTQLGRHSLLPLLQKFVYVGPIKLMSLGHFLDVIETRNCNPILAFSAMEYEQIPRSLEELIIYRDKEFNPSTENELQRIRRLNADGQKFLVLEYDDECQMVNNDLRAYYDD